jgi:hypothetical protein
MCYLLSNSIAFTKAYLDARYKEKKTSSNKPIGEKGNFYATELDDEQIKFITDSVLSFLNKSIIRC